MTVFGLKEAAAEKVLIKDWFPDNNFCSAVYSQVLAYDKSTLTEDYQLTEQDIIKIARCRQLDVSNAGIQSLQGIEHFNMLENIDCSGNMLTRLDLNNCTGLTSLFCEDNNLTDIRVENCQRLKYFRCGKNSLAQLNLYSESIEDSRDKGINCWWSELRQSFIVSSQQVEYPALLVKKMAATQMEITVDLSGIKDRITIIKDGGGFYDKSSGKLIFDNEDAAEEGFVYLYDTGVNYSSNGEPVMLKVEAAVEPEQVRNPLLLLFALILLATLVLVAAGFKIRRLLKQRAESKICGNCGKRLKGRDKFCSACGRKQ